MEGVDEWQKKNPSHLFLAPCTSGINMEVGLDNWVDILVIALYFVFVLLVGLWVCPLQHSVNVGHGALFTIICYSKYYRECMQTFVWLFVLLTSNQKCLRENQQHYYIFFYIPWCCYSFYTYFLQSMCRKERNTTKGYFLAGRSMTWFPVSF